MLKYSCKYLTIYSLCRWQTFFLKNLGSIIKPLYTIPLFLLFSGLQPNLSKCEVAGIRLLKGVKVFGVRCINLLKMQKKNTINFFSYNKNVELENFKKTIIGIDKALRMRRQRNLTSEGKIIIFKTLALSKVVFLTQILLIPNEITTTTQRIQREFLWNSSNIKIKHETIYNDFQNGGLENVDISSKISSFQSSG